MRESAGNGEGAPWFFLSYAHLQGVASVDAWVARFYADLTEAMRQRVDRGASRIHGFADLPGGGEDWRRERRASALARCRTLVALCSPDYFMDLECHSEWRAFHRRQALAGNAAAAVVPVLWERLWAEAPVQAGLNLSILTPRFGEFGLRSALTRPRLHDEYVGGVQWVARAVLAAAERVHLAPGSATDLDRRPVPWREQPTERTLRILVLAYSRDNVLPEGCDRGNYGRLPQDWRPYGSEMSLSVAELAEKQALARNFQVVGIDDFEQVAGNDAASDSIEGPQLLLLDRWALRSTRLRDLLMGYNQKRRHPMVVMVPWDPQTPGAAGYEADLQRLTLSTLDRAVGRPKPDFEPLRRGIPDADSFSEQLPQALMQARQAFVRSRA